MIDSPERARWAPFPGDRGCAQPKRFNIVEISFCRKKNLILQSATDMDDRIIALETRDVRFPLPEGAGSDAVHSGSDYAFATTLLVTQGKPFGTGFSLTFGGGKQRV